MCLTATRCSLERLLRPERRDAARHPLPVRQPIIDRAWSLRLRKRFWRSFNFEHQSAVDRGRDRALARRIAQLRARRGRPLSLARRRSRDVLAQAMLDAPMFRRYDWRSNANASLAIPRLRGGAKITAADRQRLHAAGSDSHRRWSRTRSHDPENLAGPRVIPHHLLVEQTIADGLTKSVVIDGLETLATRLKRCTR